MARHHISRPCNVSKKTGAALTAAFVPKGTCQASFRRPRDHLAGSLVAIIAEREQAAL
jgi:hypothetical protein